MDNVEADLSPINRTRRAIYCFAATSVGLAGLIGIAVFCHDSELTRKGVDNLGDIVISVSTLYVGGSVLDQSNILGLLGRRFSR